MKWNNGENEHQRKSDTLLIEKWDYKGLHFLKNNDELIIKSPEDNSTVWRGIIDLRQYEPFTEYINGLWIQMATNNFFYKKSLILSFIKENFVSFNNIIGVN